MAEFRSFGTPRLSIISACNQNFGASAKLLSGTAGNNDISRVRHQNLTGKPVAGLRLLYANYGPAAAGTGGSNTERGNANAIIVKGSVELNGTPTDQTLPRTPLTWQGQPTVTIGATPVCNVLSQEAPGIMPVAGVVYERTGASVAVTNQALQRGGALRGGTAAWGIDNGEGLQTNTGGEHVFDGQNTLPFVSDVGYSASALLGYLLDGTVAASVAILGDSIDSGADDAAYAAYMGGMAVRIFESTPHVHLGMGGERLQDFVVRKNSYARYDIARYATHIWDGYGRNDINGGRTVAQIKSDILRNAYDAMARGQNYLKRTILPAPSSTDGHFTVANQTKETAEAVRVGVNQWLRDASPSGFVAQAMAQVTAAFGAGWAKCVDVCAPVECDINGVLTTDGGYVLGNQSGGAITTGTATAGSTTSLTDASKAFAANELKGKSLYIVSGTGAGQNRCIGYNSATVINISPGSPFSLAPDATSVYRVAETLGMSGSVHPHTKLFTMVAAAFSASALLAAP